MYSNGDKQPQEAKTGGGKSRGPITRISSGAELAKAGTPESVKLRLLSVSTINMQHAAEYWLCKLQGIFTMFKQR